MPSWPLLLRPQWLGGRGNYHGLIRERSLLTGLKTGPIRVYQGGWITTLDLIDTAIATVSTTRATLGAYQNRFQHTVNNLNVSVENLTASNARIQDTDMASEMVKFTQSQILSQAGVSSRRQAEKLMLEGRVTVNGATLLMTPTHTFKFNVTSLARSAENSSPAPAV